jgi:hypothetical protein
MMPVHFFKKLILLGVTLNLLWSAAAGFAAEKPDKTSVLRELNIDACEPVRYQAKITEVNHAKGTLTVAEKQIRLMDVGANGNRLVTALLGVDEKAEPFAAYKKGDLVLIEGFSHPEGFVAAWKIQKIREITEKKKPPKASAGRVVKKSREITNAR